MKILFHRDFKKRYQKLNEHQRQRFRERRDLFLENPFHPLLNNHMLHREYQGCRSINITGDSVPSTKRLIPTQPISLRLGRIPNFTNNSPPHRKYKKCCWGFESLRGHQDKTFRLFESQIVGGAQRRPLIFGLGISSARRPNGRLAVGQNEVRAEQSSASNLFRKKVACLCNFRQIFCLFYPILERFDPASPLLFKIDYLLLQRLFLAQQLCFLVSVNFLLNNLVEIAVQKSLEFQRNSLNFSSRLLNKSG